MFKDSKKLKQASNRLLQRGVPQGQCEALRLFESKLSAITREHDFDRAWQNTRSGWSRNTLAGGLLWLSGGTLKNFPLGRLPGDVLIQNEHFTFYFPLATCILLSFGLSALLWLGKLIVR